MPEMGEYAVGAYLLLEENCVSISYGLRLPNFGNNEIDVLGFHYETMTAFVCEAKTHITGLQMKTKEDTIKTLYNKHERQQQFAQNHLSAFDVRYMFWSPKVGDEYAQLLHSMQNLEPIINNDYRKCMEMLRHRAKHSSRNIGNDFFRALQILEYVR